MTTMTMVAVMLLLLLMLMAQRSVMAEVGEFPSGLASSSPPNATWRMDPSSSSSSTADDPSALTPGVISFAVLMSVCIVTTIVGNILVVLSIFTYRPLRSVQNYYIVSLAVADLAVALFVMPFHVVNSVTGHWQFGAFFCNLWLTFDILMCTASILHLCAIAGDRFCAVHDPINYAQKRTLRRVLVAIAVVWTVSAVISIPPLFGWNNNRAANSSSLYNDVERSCKLTDEPGFVVYSSCGSFFIPLAIMAFLYAKIYLATRKRLRKRVSSSIQPVSSVGAAQRGSMVTQSASGATSLRRMCRVVLQPLVKMGKRREKGSPERMRKMAVVRLVVEGEEIVPMESGGGGGKGVEGCVRLDGTNGCPAAADENEAMKTSNRKATANAPDGDGNDGNDAAEYSPGPQESPRGPQCLAPSGPQDPNASQRISSMICRSDRFDGTPQSKNRKQIDSSPEAEAKKQARRTRNKKRNSVKTQRRSPSSSSSSGRRARGPRMLGVSLLRRGKRETADTRTQLLTSSSSPETPAVTSTPCPHQLESRGSQLSQILENRQKISQAKERRAARTMAVVMGVFVLCWFPFFLMYVVFPFCPSCQRNTDKRIQDFIVWLGYINSTLNPIIYTIFNIDFRRAFKSLLMGNCHVTS